MGSHSFLLCFYADTRDALAGIGGLRREGAHEAVAMRRGAEGGLRFVHPKPAPVWWRLMILCLALSVASLLAVRFAGVVGPLAAVAFALAPVIGWAGHQRLVRRRMLRFLAPRLGDPAAWLLTGESLVVARVASSSTVAAAGLLRQAGEGQPAVFTLLTSGPPPRPALDEPIVALATAQLEARARRLGQEQQIVAGEPGSAFLLDEMRLSERILSDTRSELARASQLEQSISAAGEWLIDNHYIVEDQIADVQRNLPRGFYRELPLVATGGDPWQATGGTSGPAPRDYAVAADLVRHSDGRIDTDTIRAYVGAYQEIQPLRIGELWALPLFLRIALIRRLVALASRISRHLYERETADLWANRLLSAARRDPDRMFAVLAELSRCQPQPSAYFATQLISHLYDESAALGPVQAWAERKTQLSWADIMMHEQRREAAEQLSVGNIVTSLRHLSQTDWRAVFESLSRVEEILAQDPAGMYDRMDFDTRDRYRAVVEALARAGSVAEETVAVEAVRLATEQSDEQAWSTRLRHVGWCLAGEGQAALRSRLRIPQTASGRLRRFGDRHHRSLYVGAIVLLTLVLASGVPISGALGGHTAVLELAALLAIALLPASQLAVQAVNYAVTHIVKPRPLPKMAFDRTGIPDAYRSLVVVPMMLTDEATIGEEIDKLEVRYLANPDTNLVFGLLGDLPDAPEPSLAEDERLLEAAKSGIAALNRRYGDGRFSFFCRQRVWCETEQRYIGWERKRGKLEELNRLIVGSEAGACGEMVRVGDADALSNIRFVITLDSDTQLPRDTARRLVEAMAHPLNDPRLDGPRRDLGRGYAIVQPRVSTSLPSAMQTRFSRLLSDPVGTDPYTHVVSDVYQDLAGEASYVGKGIYDPRVVQERLDGRFADEALLSHDLIEGAYTRTGLASDIELFDDFPPDLATYARRQHRWIRGDWQIAEWCLPWVRSASGRLVRNELDGLNRWKIFDNLRRSLVPPGILSCLAFAWLHSPITGLVTSILVALLMLFHPTLRLVTTATSAARPTWSLLAEIGHGFVRALAETALLPYSAGLALDAIGRVVYRRAVSRRHLLEWTTAAGAARTSAGRSHWFESRSAIASALAALLLILLWRHDAPGLEPAAPFLALWIASPLLVWWTLAERPRAAPQAVIGAQQRRMLRRMARRTWRYFDTFVGPNTSWLPPDNYQVSFRTDVALRTSPTNIGLWLLSVVAAHDLGYLPPDQMLERIEGTIGALAHLERYRGHLLNWYDIATLAPLRPRYVSAVDSGNLLGCLWTLDGALAELRQNLADSSAALAGLADTAAVAWEVLGTSRHASCREHLTALQRLGREASPDGAGLGSRLQAARQRVEHVCTDLQDTDDQEAAYWVAQLGRQIDMWTSWLAQSAAGDPVGKPQAASVAASAPSEPATPPEAPPSRSVPGGAAGADHPFVERIEALRKRCRDLADQMSLALLYDPERRLLRIGYNVDDERPDGSLYDLLASEARLASFIAIARTDVPASHWIALGRPFGTANGRPVLLSWTGTMFEYLMPTLLQPSIENSLLDGAVRAAVQTQIDYGRGLGVPWGVSESAYGDLDTSRTYQYRAFGVPGLGLKRGLADDLVVAPYASALALPIAPQEASANLRRLADLGLYDAYGFYESIDYSRRPRRTGEPGVLVRAYMTHHQAMTLIALDNLLNGQPMQRRFRADPRVRACEPLLYERMPAAPPTHEAARGEQPAARIVVSGAPSSASVFDTPHTDTPRTQLMSNGRMAVMVTAAGGGYTRWQELDVTRWRIDPTSDHWGSYGYVRDIDSDTVWSTGHQPTGVEAEEYTASFNRDRAIVRRRDAGIETETAVTVMPEDDVEIRRVTFVNRGLRSRSLELTSYYEVALAPQAADRAHPAFNKLFIQTGVDSDRHAVLAWRRPRHPNDRRVVVAHRIVRGEPATGPMEFETDRRHFVGRGRTLADPAAVHVRLGNHSGYVLDPILALRERVQVPAGQRRNLAMVLCAAEDLAKAQQLLDRYADAAAIRRGFELAWAQAQLELRLLRITPDDARRFQQLASYMLFPTDRLRPPADRLERNRLDQSALWAYGISGDLPIALVTIGEARDLAVVRQMLQAHTYWRQTGLNADLVILNEQGSGYMQPLADQLARLVQAYAMHGRVDQPGGVFLRATDQMTEEAVNLLMSVASVSVVAARGPFAMQLGTPRRPASGRDLLPQLEEVAERSVPLAHLPLQHANGLGGFTLDGAEYAVVLADQQVTPGPWVNVIANPDFGTLVSDAGSGYCWCANSQRNRLTPWSNDPVGDPPGDAIFLRDEDTGAYWTPTPAPIREEQPYRLRHGAGYSIVEHSSHALTQTLTTFVPLRSPSGDPVRIQRLVLRNDGTRLRRLSLTYYVEWVLGEHRGSTMMHVLTHWDGGSRALLARNRYSKEFGERIAFATIDPPPTEFSGDRTAFLGRNGQLHRPAAMRQAVLPGRPGAAQDPCAALRAYFELAPGQETAITCLVGQAGTVEQVQELVRTYRDNAEVDQALDDSRGWWNECLGQIEAELPDATIAPFVNRWLLYQAIACRLWARSGFYQSGGAYGYRDQLQDILAMLYAAPALAREHILRAAARQFVEGDVQHWWHPYSGTGVRTRIADDMLWLPYAAKRYVEVTGDEGILDAECRFVRSGELADGQAEAYVTPDETMEAASLYEHCRRAIERAATRGPHGLPTIGTGDWNDGYNRVGAAGQGESVWLAFFECEVLRGFAEVAQLRGEAQDAQAWSSRAADLERAIAESAWDGDWFRRGYYDDGTPIGAASSDECQIDLLPQAWAAISGATSPERARRALDSAWERLVLAPEQMALLIAPPFDRGSEDPGYVKGYPPGVRENGGQYTHGAVWLAIGLARMGDGDRAVELLQMLSPLAHSQDEAGCKRYAIEPYAVAGDISYLEGRVGTGGWSWYTGAAGWLYRAWLEEILGFEVRGDALRMRPVIPRQWPGFRLRYRRGEATYEIEVQNPDGVSSGVAWQELDGVRQPPGPIPLERTAVRHSLRVRMGTEPAA